MSFFTRVLSRFHLISNEIEKVGSELSWPTGCLEDAGPYTRVFCRRLRTCADLGLACIVVAKSNLVAPDVFRV